MTDRRTDRRTGKDNMSSHVLIVLKFDVSMKLLTSLTHIGLVLFLSDTGKQYNPRCDFTEYRIPYEAILFAWRNFIEKTN